MRYNVRVKNYPDGSTQFMKFPCMQDSVKKPKRMTGEHVERGKIGDIKRTIKEVYDLAKSNEWTWFLTLTFDPEIVDSFDYGAVTDAMKKFTRILRDKDIKYVIVPELHKSGRYHFHGLCAGDLPVTPGISPFTGKQIVDEKGRTVYNVSVYKYGHTTATEIDDSKRAATYITKYLSKELGDAVPKGKKRYWSSKGLNRPDVDYAVMTDRQFGGVYSGARYTKQILTDYGRFALAEY